MIGFIIGAVIGAVLMYIGLGVYLAKGIMQ